MKDQVKRDFSRLRDMCENAQLALEFAQSKTRQDLETDKLLAYALIHALQIIGEAANHVSAETQAQYPTLEWAQITGLRNRLVHGYDNMNYDIVSSVVENELTPLISTLLPDLQKSFPDLDPSRNEGA